MKRKLVKKFFAVSLLGASVLVATSCGNKNNEKIKILAETKGSPKPFVYQNDNGELLGYDVAVVKAIFDKLPEYELEIQINSSALTDVQTGIADFTFNNWTYNDERSESYYFSYPYTRAKYVINSLKGHQLYTFSDIAESGLKVYGTAGNNITNAIEQYNKKNPNNQIEIDYTSVDQTVKIQDYLDGRYVEIASIATLTASKEAYPEQYSNLEYHIIPDEYVKENISKSTTSHLLFPKNEKSDELRKKVSNVIKELYEDNTLEKLANKWVGINIVPNKEDFIYLN